jgi:peptide/nickel transport system substrate-binding protein
MKKLAALAALALTPAALGPLGPWGAAALAGPVDNSLVLGAGREPAALAPFGNGSPVSREVALWLYRDLVYVDLEGRPQPDLAAEVPTEQNGRVRIVRNAQGEPTSMTVRWSPTEGVRWSDGRPVTSDDLRLTYELLGDERLPVEGREGLPKAVAVVDERTIELTYEPAYPFYGLGLGRLGHFPAPAHVWRPLFERAKAAAAGKGLEEAREVFRQALLGPVSAGRGPAVTSGPFRFAQWRPGQGLTLTRDAGYWQPNPNGVDRVVYRFFGGPGQLETALLSGQVDALSSVGLPATPEVLARLRAASRTQTLNLAVVSGGGWLGLGAGAGELLLDDPRTRRAILSAVDRTRLGSEALLGLGRPTNSWVGRDSPVYSNASALELPYNPERARQILASLGWRPGPDGVLEREVDGRMVRFVLEYAVTGGDAAGEAVQRFLTGALRAVGIEVRPISVPSLEELRARARIGDWEGLFPLEGGGDPLVEDGEEFRCPQAAGPEYLSPAGGTCAPDLDRLLGLAGREADPARRRALFAQTQAIFARDLPVIPLVERRQIVAARRGLVNYVYNGAAAVPSTLGWLVGWSQRGMAEVVKAPEPR